MCFVRCDHSIVITSFKSPYLLEIYTKVHFSSVQSLSHVRLFATPWTTARNSQSLPKPMSIESVMPSNHLILCRPLLLLPSIFPSIRVFSVSQLFPSGGQSIGASASVPVFPMISFRIGWFDLLAVQRTLKSLLQHHSSKASILQRSAFFMVQLSHLYRTTGKTIAWTRRTFLFLKWKWKWKWSHVWLFAAPWAVAY